MKKTAAAIPLKKKLPRPTRARVRAFRKKVLDHYHAHGRALPWRRTRNAYRVLVSEIMLQQTQVERVLEKYEEFLAAFPDFPALAGAPLRKLLAMWQGMGYNRRALALRALAKKVMEEHRGRLPSDFEKLLALPGIGKYTAGAVMAFAFNKPVVFMDTNIRRVYIHEFFHGRESIHDDELMPLVLGTMDRADPRAWYNALMDYGAVLKRERVNPNRKSAHYTRQGPFENSNRQARGRILKMLVAGSPLTPAQIVKQSGMDAERVKENLVQLTAEGFIRKKGRSYFV
jgi:A/G-specific adenine glycosylase